MCTSRTRVALSCLPYLSPISQASVPTFTPEILHITDTVITFTTQTNAGKQGA